MTSGESECLGEQQKRAPNDGAIKCPRNLWIVTVIP